MIAPLSNNQHLEVRTTGLIYDLKNRSHVKADISMLKNPHSYSPEHLSIGQNFGTSPTACDISNISEKFKTGCKTSTI